MQTFQSLEISGTVSVTKKLAVENICKVAYYHSLSKIKMCGISQCYWYPGRGPPMSILPSRFPDHKVLLVCGGLAGTQV